MTDCVQAVNGPTAVVLTHEQEGDTLNKKATRSQ